MLSGWDTEKALVRWRTRARHHEVQEKSRGQVLQDYHLRVGQVIRDTRLPDGHTLVEQRLDETEVGEGTTVTLIDAQQAPEWMRQPKLPQRALNLFNTQASQLKPMQRRRTPQFGQRRG